MSDRLASIPEPIYGERPDLLELYHAAWRIAGGNVEQPPCPGWKPQLCCMPDTGIIWLWDSCFMPFFARYAGGAVPVINNLDNLYRMQRGDGFIGMAYETASETLAYGERINPPLLAWAEWHHWRFTADMERVHEVLPRLVRFFHWIKTHRRRKNGLYWFEDSGSTGMDNSPRSGYPGKHLDGSDICHVDLAAQQALSAECIASLARAIGDESLAESFDQEHLEITLLLNLYHWDARTGFYYDVFNRHRPTDRHNFLNHKTVAAFWPMMAGCCDAEQVESLLVHLFNPGAFWTRHPVASLSREDPNFDPEGGYWLGGVWPPINYMITKALQRYGRPGLARRLAEEHLKAMSSVFHSPDHAGIWEAYAPDAYAPATKKPVIVPGGRSPFTLSPETVVKANFVGWSGLGPVAMLLEDVFGFDFDAPNRRIIWNLQTSGRHGIERIAFCGGWVSLSASGVPEPGRPSEISISSEVPFTLSLLVHGVPLREVAVTSGEHTFSISASPNGSRRKGNIGFTLLECLAALAILGVLAVLLYPSVSGVLAKGRQAGCVANLRLLASASQQFFADNNGAFFSRNYTTDLQPYLKRKDNWWQPELFGKAGVTCPAVNVMRGAKFNSGIYGLNYVFINEIEGPTPNTPPTGWPLLMVNVTRPSKAWLFTEAGRCLADGSVNTDPLSYLTPGHLSPEPRPGIVTLVWPHAGGRKNFAFLDGHVESLSWSEVKVFNGASSVSKEYRAFHGLRE